MMEGKVFVEITARHDVEGIVHPITIQWTNGREFAIDKVTDIRRAASLKAGGQGMRYTCRVAGKEVYLFQEEGRWFLEV